MKQTLTVETKNYDSIITDDNFKKMMDEIRVYTSGQKRLVVISQKVYKLYCDELDLDNEELLVIKDGEKEKNFKNYIAILEAAAEIGLTRGDVIIAIGGGVVGDVAGFAASTYMRGIDYIQVPTTLLSMVDSSVGGKTAIDLAGYKNVAGTFYQPKRVFINIGFLDTLDDRQYYSGIGEILKYAFIEDSCQYSKPLFLYEYLTLCSERLQEGDPITIQRVIEYCLKLKIAVVNQDEKEQNLRKILNFGHTFGHAIEALGKFKKYTHGEAVVQGMFFMFDWAYKEGYIQYSYYRLSLDLLEKYGFEREKLKFEPLEIVDMMKKDKKADQEKVTFIIPCGKKQVKEIKIKPIEIFDKF